MTFLAETVEIKSLDSTSSSLFCYKFSPILPDDHLFLRYSVNKGEVFPLLLQYVRIKTSSLDTPLTSKVEARQP